MSYNSYIIKTVVLYFNDNNLTTMVTTMNLAVMLDESE
jgi:hypothetical protein